MGLFGWFSKRKENQIAEAFKRTKEDNETLLRQLEAVREEMLERTKELESTVKECQVGTASVRDMVFEIKGKLASHPVPVAGNQTASPQSLPISANLAVRTTMKANMIEAIMQQIERGTPVPEIKREARKIISERTWFRYMKTLKKQIRSEVI